MITCEEFTHRATEYLEGSVPFGERIGMCLHVVLCGACRRYLKQLKLTIQLTGDAGPAESSDGPSSETRRKLLDRYRDQIEPNTAGPAGEAAQD